MKFVIRLFFRTIRRILSPIVLTLDWLTSPKGVQRPSEEQQKIDQETRKLALYQFNSCPFCIKVRRHTKRLSLNIETRDALHDAYSREQLLNGGGMIKVPCLMITDEAGAEQWMYESNDIIHYLDQHYGMHNTGAQDAVRH